MPLSSNFSASVHPFPPAISSLKKKRPLVVNLSNPISRAAYVIDALTIHKETGGKVDCLLKFRRLFRGWCCPLARGNGAKFSIRVGGCSLIQLRVQNGRKLSRVLGGSVLVSSVCEQLVRLVIGRGDRYSLESREIKKRTCVAGQNDNRSIAN